MKKRIYTRKNQQTPTRTRGSPFQKSANLPTKRKYLEKDSKCLHTKKRIYLNPPLSTKEGEYSENENIPPFRP